jgi:hypothetical protein
VIHKPAAKHDTPQSQTPRIAERDTLTDTPELRFLRDEIAALLGAAAVQRMADDPVYTRDTEPSVDVQLQREAARLAGK